MRDEATARAEREIIQCLTGFYGRDYESIRDYPFFFYPDRGGTIEGTVRLIDFDMHSHLRLMADGGYLVEWLFRDKGWKRPTLYCHVFVGRPGRFELNPPSHMVR